MRRRRGLINPRSKFIQYWDLTTTMALLFTATVTPYEVCLGLPTRVKTDGAFKLTFDGPEEPEQDGLDEAPM